MQIKRVGRSTHLETPYRSSVMFLFKVFIKSSQDYASAINAVGHTCGVQIQSMPQKSLDFSKFWKTCQHPQTYVALYQDEFSSCRNPTLAKDWTRTGTKTPLAHQSYKVNETCYGIGALNPHTGDVVYQQGPNCKVETLHAFYTELCQRYPKAERIYLIQDNWSIHFQPNLLSTLLPQTVSFVKPSPPNWSGKLSKNIGELEKLPIEIIQLPTYAPWTNPIEKLWRWVRQSVLHLHRHCDDWQVLKDKVITFMSQFIGGSQTLLRYVGLLPN